MLVLLSVITFVLEYIHIWHDIKLTDIWPRWTVNIFLENTVGKDIKRYIPFRTKTVPNNLIDPDSDMKDPEEEELQYAKEASDYNSKANTIQ